MKRVRDLDALQGAWAITALENDGSLMDAAAFTDAGITIDGDRFVSAGMGGTYEGTLVIDEAKKPKAIDLVFTEGHAAGTRNLGIYKFEGDRWIICLATRGDRRPRSFATRPDTGLVLETLERAGGAVRSRSAKKTGTKAAAPPASRVSKPPAVTTGAPTSWEGEWEMVSASFSGVPMAESMVKWARRVTRGDITEVVAGPQTMLRARFVLDDTTRPHLVEYENLEGSNKGKSQSGIAEMSGDTLRICMAAPGKPRPQEFASTKGDGRSFTTWCLVKK